MNCNVCGRSWFYGQPYDVWVQTTDKLWLCGDCWRRTEEQIRAREQERDNHEAEHGE